MSNGQRVVLCGSMGAYAEVVAVAALLDAAGVPTVVPEAEDHIRTTTTPEQFELFKRRVSFAYLTKIRDPRTFAVLAVNVDRHGVADYVGPNTFAEIAVGFAQKKRIFLWQGVPRAYRDELVAWGARPLAGTIEPVVEAVRKHISDLSMQVPLFPT